MVSLIGSKLNKALNKDVFNYINDFSDCCRDVNAPISFNWYVADPPNGILQNSITSL